MIFLDDYIDLDEPNNIDNYWAYGKDSPEYFCYIKENMDINLPNLIGGTIYLFGEAFHVVNLKTTYNRNADYFVCGMKYRLGLDKIHCETFEQIKEALIDEIVN